MEKYVRLNPMVTSLMMMQVGEVWSVTRVMPMKQFHETRFYKEWVRPQGQGDIVGSLIERSGTVMTTLATPILERDSPASERAKSRLGMLLPHVRRAVAIGDVIEMNRVEADSLGDAVDAMGAAVFLVGRESEVVRSNTSGRALIEDCAVVQRTSDGRLGAADDNSERELRWAIAGAAEGDRMRRQASAIPLADREGGRYVAHVLPLTSGNRRRAQVSTGATAAVFVHKAEMNAVFPIEAVARQFDLSKAELRVLTGILDLGSTGEVAEMLGVSEATVRTHLRRLYEKTGSGRQADLVKLVAGYANPLTAPPA